MAEKEREAENNIQAPGEMNSRRWGSWKDALTGAGMGVGVSLATSFIAPHLLGLPPETMSQVVNTALGEMTIHEMVLVIGTPLSAIIGVIWFTVPTA